MTPDSSLADRVVLSRGHRRRKYLPRTSPVQAVVIHTTGPGPTRRATEDRYRRWRSRTGVERGDVGEAAVQLYAHTMDAGPHWVVEPTGRITQVCPESECAWHVGGTGARVYRERPHSWWLDDPQRYHWWRRRWTLVDVDGAMPMARTSPTHLAGGQLWAPYTAPLSLRGLRARLVASYVGGSCNAHTVGIEVPDFSSPALSALWDLTRDICERHGLEHSRERVIGHDDAHPRSRTTAGGEPWDPGVSRWTWELMESAAEDAFGLLHDRPHVDPGRGRPARAVRVRGAR